MIVVQKQSFPREAILLYLTGLINNSKEDPPPSTGLLGRPLQYTTATHCCNKLLQHTAATHYSAHIKTDRGRKNNRKMTRERKRQKDRKRHIQREIEIETERYRKRDRERDREI